MGASGFIGRYLVRRLLRTPGLNVYGSGRTRPDGAGDISWHPLELTDGEALERTLRAVGPDAVVHLAAMADVGACERDPGLAESVNANATATLAGLCGQHGTRLVFVSTEYVFDGERGFYREDEVPHPVTVYGNTKRDAEDHVSALAPGSAILRTSIVYGWPAAGKRNFVPWLIGRLRGGQQYPGSREVLRTPVYVEHLADGIATLVETPHPGVHHVAGSDWVSMYDFALAVADGFGLNKSLVVPAPEEHAASERLGLDCASTMSRLGLAQPGLREGLAAMRAAAP